jgi:hypothetical protein
MHLLSVFAWLDPAIHAALSILRPISMDARQARA